MGKTRRSDLVVALLAGFNLQQDHKLKCKLRITHLTPVPRGYREERPAKSVQRRVRLHNLTVELNFGFVTVWPASNVPPAKVVHFILCALLRFLWQLVFMDRAASVLSLFLRNALRRFRWSH